MKPVSSKRSAPGAQRGATIVLFTFITFLVVIPMVGLAIDGSIVMWEKARLTNSVDAAALAAGRSLSANLSVTSQNSSVQDIAHQYFQANFQPGQMGTTITNSGGQPDVATGQSSTGLRTVTVQASASVPLYFLRLLNFNTASIQAVGQASRKDINVILVLDRSGSMQNSGSCGPMISAAQDFVNMMVDTRDSVGLVTFQLTANVDSPASTTFKTIVNQKLGQLVCAGATNSAWGLSLAYEEIKRLKLYTASNVVVFFSDGYPNTLRFADLPIRNQPADDNDYGYSATSTSTKEQGYAHSSCGSGPISGILSVPGSASATGTTQGILKDTPYPINSTEGDKTDAAHLVTPPGDCTYNTQGVNYMRRDVAYVPENDYYGNPIATTLNPVGPQPFLSIVRFPSDSNHHYGNQLRPDSPKTLLNGSLVAADNAAFTIRHDANFTPKPVVYTIGLGSSVYDDFMERMANDPRASSFDKSLAAGLYIKAPTSAQLHSAFQQIASQVLRIAQ